MSKKQKRRATVQPLRSVRSIREVGLKTYPDAPADPEINDGEEFQARDGTNLRTMAEAEAEERHDAQVAREHAIQAERDRREAADDAAIDRRTIPELVKCLAVSPFRLVVALFKIPLETRVRLARGPVS